MHQDCRCRTNLGFLQVLESEVRASKKAEDCPPEVDGRCPNAGTGRARGGVAASTTRFENGEDLFTGVETREYFQIAVAAFADCQ